MECFETVQKGLVAKLQGYLKPSSESSESSESSTDAGDSPGDSQNDSVSDAGGELVLQLPVNVDGKQAAVKVFKGQTAADVSFSLLHVSNFLFGV